MLSSNIENKLNLLSQKVNEINMKNNLPSTSVINTTNSLNNVTNNTFSTTKTTLNLTSTNFLSSFFSSNLQFSFVLKSFGGMFILFFCYLFFTKSSLIMITKEIKEYKVINPKTNEEEIDEYEILLPNPKINYKLIIVYSLFFSFLISIAFFFVHLFIMRTFFHTNQS